ncbi:transporter substrate-binding domain-containing protein [Shewanella sp. A25]|nr:transporter substrate-binding domain-containing protein [Shewanella shenzhenensis]
MGTRWVLILCCVVGCLQTQVWAETVKLSTLYWPPYSGQKLAQQGASIAVARAAFERMGHQLEVDFFPWSRAVKVASMPHSEYIGYLPEYFFETSAFVFSKPIGRGPLGLIELKEHPISWNHIEDLNRYTLGVVKDYVNTVHLDAMIAKGLQTVETVNSDEQNIKKVAAGRIDGAVIDVHVFNYLLKQQDLKSLINRLQMNRQLLADKQLYVAFNNTEEGRRWRDIFNQGLAQVDVEALMGELLFGEGEQVKSSLK